MEHGFVHSNGIRMHYAAEGEGDLVLLLHGFPEFWYSWRHQLPALAQAGYRAVAPDLRGWGETDKPRGVAAYHVDQLIADVAGLIPALGHERAHIVGHDWGGGLAWYFAHRYPELTRTVTVLNAPHPEGFARVMKAHPRQMLMSWYMLFFQIPALPEALSRLGNYKAIRASLQHTVHPEAFTDGDIRKYVENVSRPYALTAGLNYYRAALRAGMPRGLAPLSMPALVIWGEQDPFLLRANAESARPWAPDLKVRYIPDSGHWVQCERPDLVNPHLLAFLRDSECRRSPESRA